MTEPSAPADRPQSRLSEAVEQAVAVASDWCDDAAKLAERQADRLSTGRYGLNDLIAAQVGLWRIWVSNTMRTASTLSDNLALLAYTRPAGPVAERIMRVAVRVPANTEVTFQVSQLVGRLLKYTIPARRITLNPYKAASAPHQRNVSVEMRARCDGAPNDIYDGTISSTDGRIKVKFHVAIDELGTPVE